MRDRSEINIRSYFQGGVSGAMGVLASHPCDTIKTRIQTNQPIEFNPRALYRGIAPPFFGLFVEKSMVFGTYENIYQMLSDNNKYSTGTKNIISGSVAGFVASFVVTPIEKLKIVRQANRSITREILYPKNLYKGWSATLTREVPGFGIYFWTFNKIKEKIYDGNFTVLGSLWAGGFSGAFAWLFIYPQDMVKTRIQSGMNNGLTISQIIKNIANHTHPNDDLAKNNYIKSFPSRIYHSICPFYNGFHMALLRAVPLHAVTFATMEWFKKYNSRV
jgi:solute carrier family 25 (mitochondrial carnitine/acylcarnitine transporter), member 20/29